MVAQKPILELDYKSEAMGDLLQTVLSSKRCGVCMFIEEKFEGKFVDLITQNEG
mgnify:CR=1 FL=1